MSVCLMAVMGRPAACGSSPAAHPQHSSIAEAEWNADTQRFEVALKLNGVEFEQELSFHAGLPVNLEHTADAELRVRRYVETHVQISTAVRPACRFHWVGMEVELRDVWVYFELQPVSAPVLPADAEGPADPLHSPDRSSVSKPEPPSESPAGPHDASRNSSAADDQRRRLTTDGSAPDISAEKAVLNGAVASQSHAVPTSPEEPWPPALAELRLHNSLMFSTGPEQINLMTLLIQGRRHSVHLSAEHPEAVVLQSDFGRQQDDHLMPDRPRADDASTID